MHRPGTDPEHVEMTDVLCDFCRTPWREDLPVVEGHQGSVICGTCLTVAYRSLVLLKAGTAPEGYKCTLCLEHREEPGWQSPAYEEACICSRCTRQAAGVLVKDKDYGWSKPTA